MPSLSTRERNAKFNTDDLLEHYYLYQAMFILNTTLPNH